MKRQFKYTDDVSLSYALSFFKRLGTGFRVETTGSSVTLVNHRFCWLLASERFMPWHLGELSRIKAEVKRNAAKVAGAREADRETYQVNALSFPGASGSFTVDELDLTAAYLTAAIRLDLLSEASADRLKRLPKRWRLRILGAIASKRKVDHYDAAGRVIGSEIVTDDELRHCWFVIVEYVDRFQRILRDIAADKFAFYWYDNFFCREGALKPSVLRHTTLPYKITKSDLTYHRTASLLLTTLDNKRRFFLPVPDLTRRGPGR